MTDAQRRIDDMWKGVPRETAPVIEQGAPPAEEVQAEGADIDPELGGAGAPEMPIGEEPTEEEPVEEEPVDAVQKAAARMHKVAATFGAAPLRKEAAPKKASMHERFKAALTKMAEGEMEGQEMSAPSGGDPRQSAVHYLAAEQQAQKAQEQNEAQHYRQRFQQAVAENQGMQQMMQQTQEQLMQVQQQAAEAGAQVQQSTQQAVQANDMAMQQSQQAAQMRMGMQQMRAQMLQVASQEPDAIASQMQQEQAQAQAQQLSTELQPPAEGQPAIPATPQKAEKEAVEAEKAQGQANQQAQQASQAAAGAQEKMGSAAGLMPFAAPALGAAVGAAGPLALASRGEEGLNKQRAGIQDLEGRGGFVNAMRLARAKAGLASSELATKHPVGAALMGAATGAVAGHKMGKGTSQSLARRAELLKRL